MAVNDRRQRIEPPPAVALSLEHLERRAKQDAADARVLAIATKAVAGEFRPEGQARAMARELAQRAQPTFSPDVRERLFMVAGGAPMDEDDWCHALAACLVSLGLEVQIVAVRGPSEHAWSCAVEVRDGVEWVRAPSFDEAQRGRR